MKWSWKIARIGGIDLRIHATFVLLLVWIALLHYRATGTTVGAARGVLFVLAVFASVVAHEFGHALTARRFGVPTRDITLLPIGGVARLEYIPEKPRQELAVAIAGPAVTVAIAILLYVLLRALSLPAVLPSDTLTPMSASALLAQLMWVNVWLLGFNLLPAFPMDGGRVLRALLAMRMDHLRATEIASRVGRSFALLFAVVGLFYNPILVLIAVFVWLGAASELSSLQFKSSLAGVPVDRVMVRNVQTLAPSDTLDVALRHVLDGFQADFPVVENGNVIGVLTRSALLDGLARHGRDARVDASMDRSFRTADPHEPAERAIARLQECRCRSLPVIESGHLSGVVTMENVGEFVMIANALRTPP
jgi:Zn-dependent protease/predicted transcriptional regulator